MALWTKFCGEDGSPHDPNHFECPSCGALNPRAAVAAAPRAAVAPRPPPGPPSGPPPRPGSYDIIDVDAARTRPSAVTVASASSLHIVPESAKPAGFPVHFFLHYFDFVGGVRLYTRLQGQGAYSVRLPAVMINGIDDVIDHHLMSKMTPILLSSGSRTKITSNSRP
ncbi:hypothetical protein V8E54_000065 [Elaphomyces granulatus]